MAAAGGEALDAQQRRRLPITVRGGLHRVCAVKNMQPGSRLKHGEVIRIPATGNGRAEMLTPKTPKPHKLI